MEITFLNQYDNKSKGFLAYISLTVLLTYDLQNDNTKW